MKINSFKIFILSIVFMLLSASSAYAGNSYKYKATGLGITLFEKSSGQNIIAVFKKIDKGNDESTAKGPQIKESKIKKPKIKKPKTKELKPNPPVVIKPVEKIYVTEISLNKTGTTIEAGSWERLVAVVKPDNAANKHVLWFSTRPDIASVNPSGKVTGLRPGDAVIYAVSRDNFKMASCTVTVKQVNSNPTNDITGIYLNKTNAAITVGSSETLTATVVPGNTSNSITWFSGSPGIASVDQYGRVTGISTGTTQIFAMTSGRGYVASCSVTVISSNTSVSSVSINRTTSYIALKPGSTRTLTATVEPSNATNKSLTWTSGNNSVAVIDQSGKVTAISEGTSVITVTTSDGSKTDQCLIKVIPESRWVYVTGIRLNLIHMTITVGDKNTLKYQLEPTDASNQEVSWTSSNPEVVTVSSTGEIEAKRSGNAVITANTTDGSKTASCIITVVPTFDRPANGIVFNQLTSTLLTGMTENPIVRVYPAGTSISSLSWTSSNTSVATVNQTGLVTGVSPGSAVITVRTSENQSASYALTVAPR